MCLTSKQELIYHKICKKIVTHMYEVRTFVEGCRNNSNSHSFCLELANIIVLYN